MLNSLFLGPDIFLSTLYSKSCNLYGTPHFTDTRLAQILTKQQLWAFELYWRQCEINAKCWLAPHTKKYWFIQDYCKDRFFVTFFNRWFYFSFNFHYWWKCQLCHVSPHHTALCIWRASSSDPFFVTKFLSFCLYPRVLKTRQVDWVGLSYWGSKITCMQEMGLQ